MSAEASAGRATTERSWTDEEWATICDVVRRGLASNLHCSVATINKDGSPHVTPIGSIDLTEPGRGLYFELFATGLGRNLERDPRLTLMAVDTSPDYWMASLADGKFVDHTGVRLAGVAGERRPATKDEVGRFRRRVNPLDGLPGHDLLWGKLASVRDLHFSLVAPVRFGPMSAHLKL